MITTVFCPLAKFVWRILVARKARTFGFCYENVKQIYICCLTDCFFNIFMYCLPLYIQVCAICACNLRDGGNGAVVSSLAGGHHRVIHVILTILQFFCNKYRHAV